MKPVFTTLDDNNLIQFLMNGAVGVLPTDTIYGLVCRASDQAAVKRLYALKHRENKPGTVIAANIDQLIELGIKARYLKAVERFWPGGVSVVIPTSNLEYIHLGKGGIAMRIPDKLPLIKLLLQTGPLLTTSANEPGAPPASTVKEAQAYFGDEVDFYTDGGDLTDHKPSTVIRVVDDAIEVLRQGTVKIDDASNQP